MGMLSAEAVRNTETSGMMYRVDIRGLKSPECDKLKEDGRLYPLLLGFVRRVGWQTIDAFRDKLNGTIFKWFEDAPAESPVVIGDTGWAGGVVHQYAFTSPANLSVDRRRPTARQAWI